LRITIFSDHQLFPESVISKLAYCSSLQAHFATSILPCNRLTLVSCQPRHSHLVTASSAHQGVLQVA
jgi:hypothetical protein